LDADLLEKGEEDISFVCAKLDIGHGSLLTVFGG
jgi:hypothetical protein